MLLWCVVCDVFMVMDREKRVLWSRFYMDVFRNLVDIDIIFKVLGGDWEEVY